MPSVLHESFQASISPLLRLPSGNDGFVVEDISISGKGSAQSAIGKSMQPNETADPEPAVLAASPKRTGNATVTSAEPEAAKDKKETGFPELPQEVSFLESAPANVCAATNTSDWWDGT